MAKNKPPVSEESETIRALRQAHPELAGGEKVEGVQLSPEDSLHVREAAMGIPPERRGKVMVPDDPNAAAQLPPVEDGFYNQPDYDPSMDRETYERHLAAMTPSSTPVVPETHPPETIPIPIPEAPATPPSGGPPRDAPPSAPPSAGPPVMPEKSPPELVSRPAWPTQQQSNQAPFTATPNARNPVLQKLKRNLGLADAVLEDVLINEIKFTLRLANARLKSYATTAPSIMSATTELSWSFYFNCSLAAIYIVGIDDVPLYKVLEVQPSPEEYQEMERQQNHFDPPYELVLKTVPVFFDMLLDDLRDGLAQKISDLYNEKFEKYAAVAGYGDLDLENRYQCTQPDCDETFASAIDGQFFCRIHGTPMGQALEVENANVPLASVPQ